MVCMHNQISEFQKQKYDIKQFCDRENESKMNSAVGRSIY